VAVFTVNCFSRAALAFYSALSPAIYVIMINVANEKNTAIEFRMSGCKVLHRKIFFVDDI
jgi:hypothetical protein